MSARNKLEKTILLKLIPRDKQIKKYIREMWMWVRRSDHLIYRVSYKDSTGDRVLTEFDLDARKTDQGLTDKDFRLTAPPGTPIVEPLDPKK